VRGTLGILLAMGGIAVALWGPGSGPAIGMAVFLVVLGVTVVAVANAEWFLRRTTRAADYQGQCPVGQSCHACGSFNYKPRRACRSCGSPVNQTEAS
jgi:uncharacterized paraquat-inducible protein A